MASEDIISLVLFDNHIELFRAAEHVKNKNEIYKIIDKIVSGGTTNLSGGWELGYKQVLLNDNPNYVNRIILLTDGLANEGIINKSVLLELGRKFTENRVETTTIGVGDDFDEELLKTIANECKGNFYFIENPDMTPAIFTAEIGELLSLYAQNLELNLTFLNGVQLKNIFTDYIIKNQDDRSLSSELDDAHSEDEKSILFKLDFPAVHEIGAYEVVQAKLKYRQLVPIIEDKIVEMTFSRTVLTKDEFILQKPDENVLTEIALVKAAVARMESYYLTKSGDIDGASKTLTASSFELDGLSEMLFKMGGSGR